MHRIKDLFGWLEEKREEVSEGSHTNLDPGWQGSPFWPALFHVQGRSCCSFRQNGGRTRSSEPFFFFGPGRKKKRAVVKGREGMLGMPNASIESEQGGGKQASKAGRQCLSVCFVCMPTSLPPPSLSAWPSTASLSLFLSLLRTRSARSAFGRPFFPSLLLLPPAQPPPLLP